MTTILLKRSNTPGAIPGTANLTNSTGGAEVAVNTADKRMFTITSGSAIVELGTNPSTLTLSSALAVSSGGTGTSLTPTNGQLLIGNGSGYTLSTLTAGSNITITNSTGSITIASSGAGDVVGPASATDNAAVRFDSTTGKLIQNSALTINDSGNITTAGDALINNVYIGRRTSVTGGGPDQNLVIGQSAGISLLTGGSQNLNTIVGNNAGNGLTGAGGTGNFNTMVGYGAGGNGGNNSNNTYIGYVAGSNIDATSNVAVGHAAMQGGGGSTASQNVAVGFQAMYITTGGGANTAVGYQAGDALTNANWNTLIGHSAGTNVSTGAANTFIGYSAGSGVSTGGTNCAMGDTAYLSGNYSNSIALGYDAQVTGGSQGQIGNGNVDVYAKSFNNTSDARDKTDIQDTNLGLAFVMQLQPRMYRWDMREFYRSEKPGTDATEEEWNAWREANKLANLTPDGTHKRNRFHQGLVAQEVKAVMDSMGVDFGGFRDSEVNGGEPKMGLEYTQFIAPLIKAIQELKAEFDAYKATHP